MPRRAFALLPVLLLAFLCASLALLCGATARLAGADAGSRLRLDRARLSALAAARLGLGCLAQSAGPDQRWTGNGSDGVAWVARRADDLWWREVMAGAWRGAGRAEMAWQARDLSCGADLAAPLLARERAAASARRPRQRQRIASGATQPAPEPARLAAAIAGDATWLSPAETGYAACGVRAVLVDPSTGRWRRNLSDPAELARCLDEPLARALLEPSPAVREQPARGLPPLQVGSGPARLRHMPVLTELALSFGVFNARSDGRHRVRFHAQMTLWNPSALPMLTVSDQRMFLAELEGAPEITVTNLDSGATFTTWLDRCPPGVFWGYTQGVRERGLWWWAEVLDAARHGMSRSGLLPGEVYAMLMPDPTAQPYGLSRVVGRGTWRYDDGPRPPGWLRPSPEVFLPEDRILVAMRFVTPGTTVRLHPYVGPLAAGTEAAAYPSPATVVLAHVPWPDARLELTGAEYSRVDSNGYLIGERRFCWRARLAAEDDDAVRALLADPAFLAGHHDLADPSERGRWIVTADAAGEALAAVFPARRQSLGDGHLNRHEAMTDGAFDDWRARDIPVDPPLDVPSLRCLAWAEPELWLSEVDRSFFACPDNESELPTSENPRLVPWQPARGPEALAAQREMLTGPGAAELLALEGPFNINSTDARAWEALLGLDPIDWTADAGGPAAPGRIRAQAAFFSHPTGAMLAKFGSSTPCDEPDEKRLRLDAGSREASARRQSVRAPAPEALRRFCEQLAEGLRARETPLEGVADLYRSGLIERAAAAAGLNEGVPRGSPLWIDGPTLLGAHASLLVARGDTFAVRGAGQFGGATATLELTVQRVPEAAGRPHLGRRFVVTRARWLREPIP